MDSSYYRMNSSGPVKVHSLCRKSNNSLAVSFWKMLFVVTLHILKVQRFPKVPVTWWPVIKALICWKITNLRAFLDDLNSIQIWSFSFFNTLHVKCRSRKCFVLRQSYLSPSPLSSFIALSSRSRKPYPSFTTRTHKKMTQNSFTCLRARAVCRHWGNF